ncbi:hypothetical protein K443DRAFT_510350 [Laccaria amethystina LaAM-08-1]|uniref:Unplaced genomic scaffold K443scaffold_533, whole genome shotgun sequence n=1 Tax=Laccaria amethystina LaAM-08-1 TaxID=1095629 RepID=A0A0C9WMB9_9AGAR|nr:hypothetical protein K443DRAFT_510350 [Laccaria amethystina LaAM-08-1]
MADRGVYDGSPPHPVSYPGISGIQFHKKGATRGDSPWPPEGMSAAEILAVPGAKAYWGRIAEVEAYLSYLEQALQEDVGEIAGNYYDYVYEEWEDVDHDSDGNEQGWCAGDNGS